MKQDAEIKRALLDKVEGMDIEKKSPGELSEEMESQDVYTYNFSNEGELSKGSEGDYSFAVLEDGRFLMPESPEQAGTLSYQSKEKHPELLNEINHLVDIGF
ncbi:hypothetical protein [Halobacillus campisalis]|uniref:Uncharacterized protein n=1 Tax=Halobacillus campisalis TaxID=435909 RepID=A0ABW2K9K1_9BACI|nr:hypothetical protein [Halobacillus campisalis]